jgi:hypothetical protein
MLPVNVGAANCVSKVAMPIPVPSKTETLFGTAVQFMPFVEYAIVVDPPAVAPPTATHLDCSELYNTLCPTV